MVGLNRQLVESADSLGSKSICLLFVHVFDHTSPCLVVQALPSTCTHLEVSLEMVCLEICSRCFCFQRKETCIVACAPKAVVESAETHQVARCTLQPRPPFNYPGNVDAAFEFAIGGWRRSLCRCTTTENTFCSANDQRAQWRELPTFDVCVRTPAFDALV